MRMRGGTWSLGGEGGGALRGKRSRSSTRGFMGICRVGGMRNENGGWADTEGSIGVLARCIQAGISFVTGRRGTVTGFVTAPLETMGRSELPGAHIIWGDSASRYDGSSQQVPGQHIFLR